MHAIVCSINVVIVRMQTVPSSEIEKRLWSERNHIYSRFISSSHRQRTFSQSARNIETSIRFVSQSFIEITFDWDDIFFDALMNPRKSHLTTMRVPSQGNISVTVDIVHSGIRVVCEDDDFVHGVHFI